MPLTFHDVVLTTTEPDGVTPLDGEWTLKVMTEGGKLINTEDGTVAAGRRQQDTVAGTTTFVLPAIPQANIEPDDATYKLTFQPIASKRKKGSPSFSTAQFQLSADVTLADLVSESGLPITPSLIEEATTLRDEVAADAAQVAADRAIVEGIGTTNDTVMASVAADSGSAFSTALSATIDTVVIEKVKTYDITDFGAVDDEETFTASITAASSTLTRSAGTFDAGDIGKRVSVKGAGNVGGVYAWNPESPHVAVITAVNGAEATLSVAAVTTVAGAACLMATDNTTAIQACFDAAAGHRVFIPKGRFHAYRVYPKHGTEIVGTGPESCLVTAPQNFGTTSAMNGALIAAYATPISPYGDDANRLEQVVVHHFQIDGMKEWHTGDIQNRTKGEGVNFRWGLHCRVEDMWIHDTTGDGIDFDNSKNCAAIRNRVWDCASLGIHNSNGNDTILIHANWVENNGHDMALTAAGGQAGMDMNGFSTGVAFINNVAKDNYQNYNITGTGGYVAHGNLSLGTTVAANADAPPSPELFRRIFANTATFKGQNVGATDSAALAALFEAGIEFGKDSGIGSTSKGHGTLEWYEGVAKRLTITPQGNILFPGDDIAYIGTSGGASPFYLRRAGVNMWEVGVSALRPVADGTTDLGSTSQRIRNAFVGGYQQISKVSTPAAPPANTARLFVREAAGPVDQLCVIFPNGTVKVIADNV